MRAKMSLLIILCLYILAISQGPIIGNNIYCPAWITGKTGTGSGFFFHFKSNTYLITAKHVLLADSVKLLNDTIIVRTYVPIKNSKQESIFQINLKNCLHDKLLKGHKTHDVVSVLIATDSTIGNETEIIFNKKYVHPLKFADPCLTTAGAYKLFDSVVVSNDVFILGFPTALCINNPKIDITQPLLRKGIVAGKNENSKLIIIDCPSYYGNSGGPVIEIDEIGLDYSIKVIGIVSEFVPFEEKWLNTMMGYYNTSVSNSGYTIIEPMDFILELLR